MANVDLRLVIQYNANGGQGNFSNDVATASVNESAFPYKLGVKLTFATPTRTGYKFNGWAVSSSAQQGTYWQGSIYRHTFFAGGNTDITITLYAIWTYDYVYVSFNANGGTGAPSQVSHLKGVSYNLPSQIPTRELYDFVGWAKNEQGAGTIYSAGGTCVSYNNETLYAVWKEGVSSFTLSKQSVNMDASDSCLVSITKRNGIDHHTVEVSFFDKKQTFTNVDTSVSFTIPTSWNSKIPNDLQGNAKVVVKSYLQNGEQWGEAKESAIILKVPSTALPSLSVNVTQLGDDTAISWGVFVQGYSAARFNLSASGVYSSTIVSIEIKGVSISQKVSSSSLQVDSDVFTSYGDFVYTAIAVDSRGRSITVDTTISVLQYHKPAIVGFSSYRSDNQGVIDEFDGAYITVRCDSIDIACSSNNTFTIEYKYKIYRASSYTSINDNAQVDTNYIVAADISKTYEVYAKVTDALGNYTEYSLLINSIACALSLGLNNDRARFGGAARQQGLECDWLFRLRGRFFADDHFQRGYVNQTSIPANDNVELTIQFNSAFTIAPVVVATLSKTSAIGGNVVISVYSISTDSFKLRLENNSASSITVGALWIAIL